MVEVHTRVRILSAEYIADPVGVAAGEVADGHLVARPRRGIGALGQPSSVGVDWHLGGLGFTLALFVAPAHPLVALTQFGRGLDHVSLVSGCWLSLFQA